MSRIDQSKIDKILSKRQVSYDHDEQGVDIWQVQSQDLSNVYIISHTPAKSSGDYEFDESWECSCPSYEFDKTNTPRTCKHIEAVKQYLGRKKDEIL